jgi:hypothetical protein
MRTAFNCMARRAAVFSYLQLRKHPTKGPQNRRSLHSATPDFLLMLVALADFMRLSLRKAAHAAVSSAAWQEIRVRSGRDDKAGGDVSMRSVA